MMVRILTSAKEDLVDGFHFHEDQSQRVGAYFLDSLFSDESGKTLALAYSRVEERATQRIEKIAEMRAEQQAVANALCGVE